MARRVLDRLPQRPEELDGPELVRRRPHGADRQELQPVRMQLAEHQLRRRSRRGRPPLPSGLVPGPAAGRARGGHPELRAVEPLRQTPLTWYILYGGSLMECTERRLGGDSTAHG
jgi:hypothetical protein